MIFASASHTTPTSSIYHAMTDCVR